MVPISSEVKLFWYTWNVGNDVPEKKAKIINLDDFSFELTLLTTKTTSSIFLRHNSYLKDLQNLLDTHLSLHLRIQHTKTLQLLVENKLDHSLI